MKMNGTNSNIMKKTDEVPNKPILPTKPSINDNKYNPDVMDNYGKIKDYKIGNITYSNETWKGITGDKMDFKVNDSKSFAIEIEKVDSKQLEIDFIEEYNIRDLERINIEKKNNIIKGKMLENVMQMVDEICDDNIDPDEELVSYDILKLEGTHKGMETEHTDYNRLLATIEEL